MTLWRMDPAGIDGVLARAGEARASLAGSFTESAVEGVGAGLGWSPQLCGDVVTAVGELASGGYTSFLRVLQRVDAGTAGVYNAAVAYHQAADDMTRETKAAEFEAQAVISAETGNFTFFEQNGFYS